MVIKNKFFLVSENQTIEDLSALCAKKLDKVFSSTDFILIYLGRIKRILEPTFAGYPETVNQLLKYLP
jgi:hypothetical protein